MSLAARLGDMCAHGGTIVVGAPTVMIGGMPAARVGDMHVCPMVTPGTPPVPHVGGPALPPGSPTVLICGMPALRMGDMLTCVGPPDVVAAGCPTVMIGMSGAGSGSGSAAPGAASSGKNASKSAEFAMQKVEFPIKEVKNWITFKVQDKAKLAVAGMKYHLKDADGKEYDGTTQNNGLVHRNNMASGGNNEITLYAVYGAKWSKETAKVGDTVKMEAKVMGIESGEKALFQIIKRDLHGPHVLIKEIEATTQGDKVEAEWKYDYSEQYTPELVPDRPSSAPLKYSAPDYYFEVIVKHHKARSGYLQYQDWIEVKLLDDENNPIANADYLLYFSNGEIRKGRLDGNGKAKIENVPPVPHKVVFPRHLGVTVTDIS
jgi:uncharacterized Zn-binding protein involved in type VI secretion